MNRKIAWQAIFAMSAGLLLTTGCSNDVPTAGIDPDKAESSVVFNINLPAGDEVNYTRADEVHHDAAEQAVNTLKVYHFRASGVNDDSTTPADADYFLVRDYDVTIGGVASSGEYKDGVLYKDATTEGQFNLRLSLSGKANATDRHAFVFVANDRCSAFEDKIAALKTTEHSDLSSISMTDLLAGVADKQITAVTDGTDVISGDAATFLGDENGLCMTAKIDRITLNAGVNQINPGVELQRIMARLDVREFVPDNYPFELRSIKLKYPTSPVSLGAPKGYLFGNNTKNIWSIEAGKTMEINHCSFYADGGYPVNAEGQNSEYVDVTKMTSATDANRTATGVWYKKVLYMYEFPKQIAGNDTGDPVIEVTYAISGEEKTAAVPMVNNVSGDRFDIARNTVYTLIIGDLDQEAGKLTFTFTDTPWTLHEIDADLNEGIGK